jgi:ATP-dependent RNA helicase SUPV3L1/SUV3
VHEAVDEAFVLANDGVIRWLGEPVGKISAGDHILKPRVRIVADETLSGPQLEMAQTRLDLWLAQHVKKLLGALDDLETGDGLEGAARGVAFQIGESLGVLERSRVAEEMKALPQEARGALRKLGIRFGAYHLYLPALLKPAPRALATQLWALQNGGLESVKGLDDVAHLASSGRTSFAADLQVNRALYRAAGFRVCGERAVRVDILERLADLIRPAIAYRPGATVGDPPAGAADGDGFVVTVAMTSLAGCSGESFASILKSLSYVSEQRPGPAITVPILPKASMQPIRPPVATVEAAPAEEDVAEASETPIEVKVEALAESESAAEAAPAEEPLAQAEAAPVEDVVEAQETENETETEAAPIGATVETPAPAQETPEGASEETSEAASEAEGETAAVAEAEAEVEADLEASSEVTEAAPAEPVLIEVWKPQRHQHARRREPGQDQQHRRHGPRRSHGAPQPAGEIKPVEGQPSEGRPAAQEGAPQEGARPERRQFDRPRRDDPRPEGGGKPRFDGNRPEGGREPRKFEGKFDGKRRDDQRGERPVQVEKRPPREKQADPDSPFAKLAALKAELEAKSKKN